MHFVSQSEQPGGYWLVGLALDSTNELPYGYQLLSASNPDIALSLFSQQGRQAQFLSQTPLSKIYQQAEQLDFTDNSDTLAWQIFNAQNVMTSQREAPILLLAKDLTIANLFHYVSRNHQHQQIALLEATDAFPFPVKPARFMFEGLLPAAIGACPLLEDWHVPNRLCSTNALMGCHEGSLEDLMTHWHPSAKPDYDWQILDFRSLNNP